MSKIPLSSKSLSLRQTRRAAKKSGRRRPITRVSRQPGWAGLETLEPRLLLSTFTVTNTADAGPGSLRQAMLDANANVNAGGPDDIEFNIPGAGPHVITPGGELPEITDPVVIDGYTQAGAAPNTQPMTEGADGTLTIVVNGLGAGTGARGLHITGGGSTVRGLVIQQFGGDGILITNLGGNVIEGNYIGTDVSGTADLGNGNDGIAVTDSPNNTIGGTAAGAGNLISGNADDGIDIDQGSANNVVEGNLIGTDVTGMVALPNLDCGVEIEGGSGNRIGGDTPAERNVISGNAKMGVYILDGATDNLVFGNYIGTDINGMADLGNQSAGVRLVGASDTRILDNTVAFNAADTLDTGILVLSGTGNAILGNSVFSNEGLGIDLFSDSDDATGVTHNDVPPASDPPDTDGGTNNLQNFPDLSFAGANGTSFIAGSLSSTPNTDFRVEFFSNTDVDPSGFGEGETFLEGLVVTTDNTGQVDFGMEPGTALSPGSFLTATATRLDDSANPIETSEYSAAIQVCGLDVTTTDDGGFGSLRDAIICANGLPGPNTINLPAGTYGLDIIGPFEDAAEAGDLDITDDLTIVGADADTTIINAGGLGGDAATTGEGPTYVGSGGDRVFHVHGVTADLSAMTITGGNASGLGGGLLNEGGSVTLSEFVADTNKSSDGGGGLATLGSRFIVDTLNLTNVKVSNNETGVDGGGIYAANDTLNISNSVVDGNRAVDNGGGIAIVNFTNGTAVTLNLADSTVSNNEATSGGGVHADHETVNVQRSTFSGNTATFDGGGYFNRDSTASIENSTFSGNDAGVGGGGIFNFASAASSLTSLNNTITNNRAGSDTTSSTTTNGEGGPSGGGIYNASGTLVLHNTIVAGNFRGPAGSDGPNDVSHSADASSSFNLIGVNSITGLDDGVNGNMVGTLAAPIDSLLGPLADNGGPTQTHALLAGSPALDTADDTLAPSTDQRGEPRPQGLASDKGAFEGTPDQNPLSFFVAFGTERLKVGKKLKVADGFIGGDQKAKIGKKSQTLEIRAGDKLKIRKKTEIDGDVIADGKIKVQKRSQIDGDLDGGDLVKLQKKVTVNGQVTAAGEVKTKRGVTILNDVFAMSDPIAFESPELPAPTDFTTDPNNDIRVTRSMSADLEPGAYGDLKAKKNAVVNLTSGEYFFDRFKIGRNGTLNMDVSDGDISIFVDRTAKLSRNAGVTLIGGAAESIFLEAHRKIKLAVNVDWLGTLYAPNNKVKLGRGTSLEGAAYSGGKLVVRKRSTLDLVPANQLSRSVLVNGVTGESLLGDDGDDEMVLVI